MRIKLSLAIVSAAAAAAGAVALTTPAASALVCPPGTYYEHVDVAGRSVTYCSLEGSPPCDPGPCEPPATARAPQE